MNVTQKDVTIQPHTQLAMAFLVDQVVEPSDNKVHEHHGEVKKGVCLSLGQVAAGFELDLGGEVDENEEQRTPSQGPGGEKYACVLPEFYEVWTHKTHAA